MYSFNHDEVHHNSTSTPPLEEETLEELDVSKYLDVFYDEFSVCETCEKLKFVKPISIIHIV